MADTVTPILGLLLPQVYPGDQWGGKLNANFTAIDVFAGTAPLPAAEAAKVAAQLAQANAELAETNAELAETNAETARDAALAAQMAAELAETNAETARDAAFVNANVYANTTDGLAAVALSGQFQVVSGDEIIRYREDAGPVATEVARYPAADYVFNRLDGDLSTLSGYSFAVMDQTDRPAIAVTVAGVVEMPGTPVYSATYERPQSLSQVVWGVTDQNDRLAFGVMSSGNILSKGEVVDLEAIATTVAQVDAVLYPSTVIDCLGDSLTQGNTSGVTVPYPTALATLLPGRTVANKGFSGRTSLQIATAFGAVPSILTVTSNTVPTSGAVSVTLTENGNFSSKSNFGTINTVGSLFGIPGTLGVAFNAGNPNLPGTSTFTRTTAGTATVIPNRTPFIPTTSGGEGNTVVIWSGRNDIISQKTEPLVYTNQSIINNITAMVGFLSPLQKRFVVLSIADSAGEYAGSGIPADVTAYNNILAINYELSRLYPRNFVDVRKILVNSYNPSLPTDVTAFSRDQIPPSLQQDGLHLNDAGYAIVAQAVYNFISLKGW